MKKWIALLLCACMAFSLCACSAFKIAEDLDLPPLPEVNPEAASEPVPTLPATDVSFPEGEGEQDAAPIDNRIIVSCSTTKYEQYDPADGTQLILTFSYETPVVHIEGREEASDAINEYIAMLDETFYTGNDYGDGPSTGFNAMLEAAEDNFTYVIETGTEGIGMEYSESRKVRIERADSTLLSLVFTDSVYTGGAHGITDDRAYVFDTETGKRLRLDDLTQDYSAFENAVVDAMLALRETDEGYNNTIPEGYVDPADYRSAFSALLRQGSWYLGQDGLVLFSSLYELGPYASGIAEFTIPYEDLKTVMDERWFPPERQGSGELSVQAMSEVPDGSVEIVDRAVVDEGGGEVCLLVSGTVYDLSLSRVYYSDDLSEFYQDRLIWYTSSLTDAALQIAVIVPDVIPNLHVAYRTADGEVHGLLLSQSGMDGSYFLMEDKIESVG